MIGLGTYAFFWELQDGMTLRGAIEATRRHGVDLFQICDFAPLEAMTDAEIADVAAVARDLGIRIQLGTKGVEPAHLDRILRLAEAFDARLVRSMLFGAASRPTHDDAAAWLREALPAYEASGVTLALETYEQVATADLVALVESFGSASLGVCLDPANVVARLEPPRETVELAASVTVNVHAKDFAFARQDGWVGFTYSGARMGEGLHDYPHLLETVRPRERGIDEIVEHWLPWQGDFETTIRAERDWTRTALTYLEEAA